MYIPAIVSANKPIDSAEQNDSADQTAKGGGSQTRVASNLSLKADGKQGADNLLTAEAMLAKLKHEKSSGGEGPTEQQVASKPDAVKPSDGMIDVNPDQKGDSNIASSVVKMKSLSTGSKEGGMETVGLEKSTQSDVVTVGSMRIKVNGTIEPTSKAITVGSVLVEPEAMKLDKKDATSDGDPSRK